MFPITKKFIDSEEGAVTVDWVVLTAAVVGLAVVVILTIHGSSGNVGNGIKSWLSSRPVG